MTNNEPLLGALQLILDKHSPQKISDPFEIPDPIQLRYPFY